MITSSITKIFLTTTLVLLLILTSSSSAGLLGIAASSNGDIVSGTAGFNVSGYGEHLQGTVDFAVFDTSVDNPFSSVSVGSGRYLYAYQINTDVSCTSIGSLVVGTYGTNVFEVTTYADGDVDVASAHFNQAGVGQVDVDPAVGSSDTVAAEFDFNNALTSGQTSYILLLSSDQEFVMSSISGDDSGYGASINGTLLHSNPIFVPEPATLAIFGIGGFVAIRRRKKA